jgi:hypothetical protein
MATLAVLCSLSRRERGGVRALQLGTDRVDGRQFSPG